MPQGPALSIPAIVDALRGNDNIHEISLALENTYNKPLPRPGPVSGNPDEAVVWRGLGAVQLIMMVTHKSAGNPANPAISSPTQEEVIAQVGEYGHSPEFTFDPSIAEGFGTDAFVAAFKINTRYLAKGSVGETGVVCKREAPLELLAFKKGRPKLAKLAPRVRAF